MKCNHCGTEFEAKFCPECGARANFGSLQPEQQVSQPAYQTGAKPKKKKKPFLIILLLLVVIVAVGTVLSGNQNDSEPTQATGSAESITQAITDNAVMEADSTAALEALILVDAENTVSELYTEYGELILSIDSYKKYVKNTETVEAFYDKAISTSENLALKLCEYSVAYAELLINSDKSYDDIYDELEGIYDCIYDDVGDVMYDGIYDGILDDIYDDFYSGIIEDAMDTVAYSEWAEVRSDEYEMWSDTRSDCYEIWSDMRSDIYGFYCDLRGDIFSDDMEDAKETISKFKADIQKSASGNSVLTEPTEATATEATATEVATSETTIKATTTTEPATEKEADLVDGMRPEFKEAMDSYETFMTDYVDFMKKFEEDSSDLSLLVDYADYMSKYAEFVEDFEAWDDEEMNNAETAYYIDVQARVSKKLLEIS